MKAMLLAFVVVMAACTSPEAERTRGGGPGADLGNRGNPVVMHEGSKPYENTPRLIAAEAPALDAAMQARTLATDR